MIHSTIALLESLTLCLYNWSWPYLANDVCLSLSWIVENLVGNDDHKLLGWRDPFFFFYLFYDKKQPVNFNNGKSKSSPALTMGQLSDSMGQTRCTSQPDESWSSKCRGQPNPSYESAWYKLELLNARPKPVRVNAVKVGITKCTGHAPPYESAAPLVTELDASHHKNASTELEAAANHPRFRFLLDISFYRTMPTFHFCWSFPFFEVFKNGEFFCFSQVTYDHIKTYLVMEHLGISELVGSKSSEAAVSPSGESILRHEQPPACQNGEEGRSGAERAPRPPQDSTPLDCSTPTCGKQLRAEDFAAPDGAGEKRRRSTDCRGGTVHKSEASQDTILDWLGNRDGVRSIDLQPWKSARSNWVYVINPSPESCRCRWLTSSGISMGPAKRRWSSFWAASRASSWSSGRRGFTGSCEWWHPEKLPS